MKRNVKRNYVLGPFASVVGVLFPWAIGVITIVTWLLEGLF
jgi:hypothetical protein